MIALKPLGERICGQQCPSILPGAEMRRSTRIVRAVPMQVTGVDLLGQPFWERTATLDVNSHGCKFPSKLKLRTNSRLTWESPIARRTGYCTLCKRASCGSNRRKIG